MKDCKAERKTEIRRMVFAFAVSIAVAAMGLLAVFSVTADEAQADEGVPTIVWGTDVIKGGCGANYDTPTYVYYGSYPQSLGYTVSDDVAERYGLSKEGDILSRNGKNYYYVPDVKFPSNAENALYLIEPISWAVMSTTPSGKQATSGNATGSEYTDDEYSALTSWKDGDGLFLLSEYELDAVQFHTDQENRDESNSSKKAMNYTNCTLRSWLNGYSAAYNIGDNAGTSDDRYNDAGVDYSANGYNFISLAFTSAEKARLLNTVIDNPDNSGTTSNGVAYILDGGNATQDLVFAVKLQDVFDYAGNGSTTDQNVFKNVFPTASCPSLYAAGHMGSFTFQSWWIRDTLKTNSYTTNPPTAILYPTYAAQVAHYYDGYGRQAYYITDITVTNTYAVRPAVNLGTDDVLFVSSAKRTGSLCNTANSEYGVFTGNNISAKTQDGMDTSLKLLTTEDAIYSWKLTMKADNYGKFTAKTIRTDEDKNTITISYAGATTGTNQNISILVKDATFTGDASNISSVESALNGDGDFSAYGRVLTLDGTTNGASGTATFTLPDGLTWEDLEGKTIYVYNEQYNGETATDYASNLVPISLSAEKYTVTYDMNGGTLIDGKSDVKDSNSYQWGDEATVLSGEGVYQKPVDGTTDKYMTCTGWNTKADGSGTAYAAGSELSISDSNVKLYAQYEDKNQKYTISYDTNDGSDVTDKETGEKISDDGEPNQEEGYADDVIDLSERTTSRDDGAIFMGWYDNAELSGDPITSVQLTGNTTLYAAWGWEVTFDADGGELAFGTEEKVSILEGTAVTKPADPTREGYTFKGWRIEGSDEDYDFSSAITGSIKLVAQWEKLPGDLDTDDLTPEVNTDSNGTSSASGSKSTADTGDSSHVVLFAAVSLLIALGLGVYTGVWIRTRRRQR